MMHIQVHLFPSVNVDELDNVASYLISTMPMISRGLIQTKLC